MLKSPYVRSRKPRVSILELFFSSFLFFFSSSFILFFPSITYIGKHSLLKRCQIRFLLFLSWPEFFFPLISFPILLKTSSFVALSVHFISFVLTFQNYSNINLFFFFVFSSPRPSFVFAFRIVGSEQRLNRDVSSTPVSGFEILHHVDRLVREGNVICCTIPCTSDNLRN